ncbi:unnamed protein product [Arctia plantaginis]|uniref:Uncharacterized protein n=1 Tax=Arctia plantaginis TaxID=874455 RepID=A0A8S0YR38_ARCPL|nr:unnamed protein product [Arctia plantaginis]
MFSRLVIFLVLFYFSIVVETNDVSLGHATPYSKKIYSAIKTADPALWKRRDDILINAPNNDFISAVYVTDLRSDKEGEAYVAAGGIGSRSVTIKLKSPSILRGYKFQIDVYADSMHSNYPGNFRTSLNGFSGYGAYPNTYPVNSVSYPVSNVQYPASSIYPQYAIGR